MIHFPVHGAVGAWPRAARVWVAGALALALAACGGGGSEPAAVTVAQSSPAPADVLRMDGMQGPSTVDALQVQIKSVARSARAPVVPHAITLAALDDPKDMALQAPAPGQPLQIGIARDVAEAADVAGTAGLLNWSRSPDGRQRAAVAVQSPGAAALRLGLRVQQLPLGTQLRVYAPGADEGIEIAGAEVLRTVQTNLDAGATGAAAYTYWLPTVDGAQAVLEIELAAGVPPSHLKVSLPQVSHFKAHPAEAEAMVKALGDAASCNVDVMCTSGNDSLRLGVARMVYAKGGKSYLCTGTLLNNKAQDGTPYFLSANHCISEQAVASSLETWWDYRASTCNSGTLFSDYQRLQGGAQLLYASSATDTSFMRLNTTPAKAYFAGWDATAPQALNANVFGIHHPRGDLQKYSAGAVVAFASCSTLDADRGFSCTLGPVGRSSYYRVGWRQGTTESGSSGSAIFNDSKQVVGQLYGGSSSCTGSGSDAYGRFDLAYAAALKTWLNSATPPTPTPPPASGLAPVYRFYNVNTNAHFYTNNSLERDYVSANWPQFHYEGVAYQTYKQKTGATTAVYRFYNTVTGIHFYTISADERDLVMQIYPDYTYEGPSWYAQTAGGNGATALYRFYSGQRRAHFYTTSAAERDQVIRTLPDFNYEGVAYYVWPAP